MPPSLQIIFSGLPGTGKSTLARMLGRQFKLPVFETDRVKQALLYGIDASLNLPEAELFEFDTTDFSTLDFSKLFDAVASRLP